MAELADALHQEPTSASTLRVTRASSTPRFSVQSTIGFFLQNLKIFVAALLQVKFKLKRPLIRVLPM